MNHETNIRKQSHLFRMDDVTSRKSLPKLKHRRASGAIDLGFGHRPRFRLITDPCLGRSLLPTTLGHLDRYWSAHLKRLIRNSHIFFQIVRLLKVVGHESDKATTISKSQRIRTKITEWYGWRSQDNLQQLFSLAVLTSIYK